ARRVQDARGHQPACSRLDAIGFREVQYAVVALVPALEATADVGLGRSRLQAEEGEGEVVAGPVELWWEVVALGLAFAAELGGLVVVLVHVVGDRPQVVEELAIDRPPLVGIPEALADHLPPDQTDGILEGEAIAVANNVTQPLVGGRSLIGGRGRRGKPALVDPAAVRA